MIHKHKSTEADSPVSAVYSLVGGSTAQAQRYAIG